jgi:hypothetical protein
MVWMRRHGVEEWDGGTEMWMRTRMEREREREMESNSNKKLSTYPDLCSAAE